MKNLKIICICLILSSCVSLNTHQSGRSIGKDNIQCFTNINYGKTHVDSFVKTHDNEVYLIEIGGYVGISNKTDVGVKISNSLKLNGLLKSQIIGTNKSLFASSIATDIGAGIIGMMSFNANTYLINSLHPTDYLAFTLTPKYAYSSIFRPNTGKNDTDHLYGYSAGVILGRKNKISIEIAQFSNSGKNFLKNKPFIGIGILTDNLELFSK